MSTTTHRLTKKAFLSLEAATFMQFPAAMHTSTHNTRLSHGTDTKQRYIFLLTNIWESVGLIVIEIQAFLLFTVYRVKSSWKFIF